MTPTQLVASRRNIRKAQAVRAARLPHIPPAEALALSKQGFTLREIAARYPGTSRMTACRAIRRALKGAA